MKLLNLGCGNTRSPEPFWTNLDDLRSQLAIGEASRTALDAESNYINFDVSSGPLPFDDNSFAGVLASHFFEHFDAQEGLRIMRDCRRILMPGGTLMVSVPDASYFRAVYPHDRNENWPALFDTTDPANPIPTFFEAALWFEQHKVIMTEDAVWCYFVRAGFDPSTVRRFTATNWVARSDAESEMGRLLNRQILSVMMAATK